MHAPVNLPPGPLIEYLSFCKAIAQAVYPVRERGLKGIECVVGKMATPKVSTAPIAKARHLRGRSTPGHKYLEIASLPGLPFEGDAPRQSAEVCFPCELDENDRRALETVLDNLPPLRYPMSRVRAAAFMDAYRNLLTRPDWEPVLMTAEHVAQQHALQEQHFDKVLQSLREEFAAGRLVARTQSGLPVKAMALRCFIPRQSAIDYLNRCGLAHSDMEASSGSDEEFPGPQGAIKCELTNNERQELVAYRKALEVAVPKVKAPTKQTAEKFNVSESYVRRLLREDKVLSKNSMFPGSKRK